MEIKANFFPEMARPLCAASSGMAERTPPPSSSPAHRSGEGAAATTYISTPDNGAGVWASSQPSETEVTLWLRAAALGRVAHAAAEDEAFCDMERFEDMASYARSATAAASLKQFARAMQLDEREELCLRSALDMLRPVDEC
jgi:hypothetical protein